MPRKGDESDTVVRGSDAASEAANGLAEGPEEGEPAEGDEAEAEEEEEVARATLSCSAPRRAATDCLRGAVVSLRALLDDEAPDAGTAAATTTDEAAWFAD